MNASSSSYAATQTVCASGCGYTTIGAAIAAASAGDTISIQDAVHTEAGISVYKNLTIQGQGAANTAVDGGASGPVFTISGGVTATIQGMTVRNGSASFAGGILNHGTLTISNSTLSGNSAPGGTGGGIFNDHATLTISNSTLSGNSAPFGGGIRNENGTLTISNGTLSGNSAPSQGGGIYSAAGTVMISSSTLSGNSAPYGGGILNQGGTLTISDSTLSGNSAGYGGGIFNYYYGGTATISSSTLSGNSATYYAGGISNYATATIKNSIVGNGSGGDCFGTIAALGANLDTDGSCGGTNFTAVTSAQLNLGPLALNAPGTTETLALLPGSVAIDAATDCTDAFGTGVTKDQRGIVRPDAGESACDIRRV